MKLRDITLIIFLFTQVLGSAQNLSANSKNQTSVRSQKTANNLGLFHLGVASGEPSSNSVVIWTKVLGDSINDVNGIYLVARDTGFTQVVHSGSFTTGPQLNYTVKVNINNLNPDTYYYYYFSALGENSLTGRTKTAPVNAPLAGSLKFAVLSCQHYEHGYFNILGEFAKYNELDAVVHLGDYIYEDEEHERIPGRAHGLTEAVSLNEYRQRYELYKTDPDLIRIHQQYPFLQVWDDHEIADNGWKDGAANHNPNTEGPWNVRKSNGYQAFYEYQPMWPGQDSSVYRSVSYGSLAEMILLDTRFVGRQKQIYDVTDSLVYDSNRTILGTAQYQWLANELSATNAQWKLIANQVFFSPFHIGWSALPPQTPNSLENLGLDIWDGYPMERKKILNHISSNQIDDVVIMTGSIHAAFANEVADPVNDTGNGYAPIAAYNPLTGAGAHAVEFITPGVSSDNYDEKGSAWAAAILESKWNTPLANGNVANPHTKFVDLDRHGGYILTVDNNQAQADYYFVDTHLAPSDSMYLGKALYVASGTHLINVASVGAPTMANPPIPAPLKPRTFLIGLDEDRMVNIDVTVYPNPAKDILKISSQALSQSTVTVKVYNLAGIAFISESVKNFTGEIEMNVAHLPAGSYFLALEKKGQTHIRKIQIVR